MSKFAVGDRVRIYESLKNYIGTKAIPPKVGIIRTIDEDITAYGDITAHIIGEENSFAVWVYLKQCRKLKPKRKRKEIWINFYLISKAIHYSRSDADKYRGSGRIGPAVKFIEAKDQG